MTTDFRQRAHRLDQPGRDVAWMRARKPDPLDAIHLADASQQIGEIAAGDIRRLIAVDDLTEQLHLARARLRGRAHVGNDVRDRPHALVPPRVWDDAEGTELVAPFDDGDVGLERILTPRNSEWE